MFSLRQIALLIPILVVACGGAEKKQAVTVSFEEPRPEEASAILLPTEDSLVTGIVDFTRKGEIITVSAEFQGLEPGLYCFHIHEFGDCSGPYAEHAGGYFCSEVTSQGGNDKTIKHFGNYENLVADGNGSIVAEFTDETLTLEGPHSILNRSVIVDASISDTSTGSSVSPCQHLACGVIEHY